MISIIACSLHYAVYMLYLWLNCVAELKIQIFISCVAEMKPIFCGNLEYDSRQSELERLFGRYGRVDRVDMKSG